MKTWEDIYKLPLSDQFVDSEFRSGRVVDSKDNFVFQFIYEMPLETQITVLDIINSKEESDSDHLYTYHDGYILSDGIKGILIRGWGNLTGQGGHNLSPKEAANVQDTFAEFIISKLTKKS